MNSLDYVVQKVLSVIRRDITKKTTGYDAIGIVRRIDGNTAWVHFDNGVDETPVNKSINCTKGDKVRVRISNGSAFLVGNDSAPPTDDTKAEHAQVTAEISGRTAEEAQTTASEAEQEAGRAKAAADSAEASATSAQASAENASEYASRALGNLSTVQSVAETLTWITQHGTMALTQDQQLDPTHVYFVVDAGGDYVVGGTHYSIVTEPDEDDLSTYYELTIDESLNNYVGTHLAVDGEGLWLLPATSGTNKVLIATGAGSTYTTAGTYIISKVNNVDTVLAQFTSACAVIGDALGAHSTIDEDGMQIYSTDSNDALVELANIGYGLGNAQSGTATAPYYTLGSRASGSSVGNYSVAEGTNITASGKLSHAEGLDTVASGYVTHAEGIQTTASALYSHAEGYDATASGDESHAEGIWTTASGDRSHAEGSEATASGNVSHAEGHVTTASEYAAHAEGDHATASERYSHAQNHGTKASSESQTALGKYNIEDATNTYAVIIGNGSSLRPSNALTVDWSGNVNASGDITDGTGNVLSDKADTTAIPTVNNATLTIQKNGTDVQTFTANASTNKTANITVPTATSDLTNDSGFIASDSNGNVTIPGKATLGAINGDTLFDYSTVSMTSSSISANASGEVTSSASNKANYYPIAITNVNISTGQASLRRFYFSTQQSGKAVVKIGLQNDGTSAKTISVSADILWVKVTA